MQPFMNWPLVEGTIAAWRKWRDDEAQRDAERPHGCQFEHPMNYCKMCGTYMHCKDEEGPWRRRPNDER